MFKCYMSNQVRYPKDDFGNKNPTIVPINEETPMWRIINRHVILDNGNKMYYTSEFYNPILRYIKDNYNKERIREKYKIGTYRDEGYCEVSKEFLLKWLDYKLNDLIENNPCRWEPELHKSEINNLKNYIKKIKRILNEN